MSSQEQQLALLRRVNAGVRVCDPGLAEETGDRSPALELARPVDAALVEETIVMRRQRPVLAIQQGTTSLVFHDAADSEIWKARLAKAKDVLDPAIAAVGRVDLGAGL